MEEEESTPPLQSHQHSLQLDNALSLSPERNAGSKNEYLSNGKPKMGQPQGSHPGEKSSSRPGYATNNLVVFSDNDRF